MSDIPVTSKSADQIKLAAGSSNRPPGLDHELHKNRSDAHIFKTVSFGFGRMPPFRDKLTPEDRWNLVNYLRTHKFSLLDDLYPVPVAGQDSLAVNALVARRRL